MANEKFMSLLGFLLRHALLCGVKAHVPYTHTRRLCPTLTPLPFALALVSDEHPSRTHAFLLQEEISYGHSQQCLHNP